MSTMSNDLAEFSTYIDDRQAEEVFSANEGVYARVAKITEEAGELSGALLRYNGHNVIKEDGEPTAEDIGKHILSVAIAALGAYEHWTGNQGLSVPALEAQVRSLRELTGGVQR